MKAPPLTVLIIDDAKGVLLHLTLILERAGYKVLTATNGEEGLRITQTKCPDIILCDIMMPGLNGFEVRKILARNAATAAIPFIFLTARSAQMDKLHGIETGADDYITKPFDQEELLARVKAVLRRATLSHQQGLTEAKAEIEKLRSTILSQISQELRPTLDKVLAALILTLTEHFAHDFRQQKQFIQIALDNACHLHTLVKEMAHGGELSQEQMDVFLQQVVDLESEFYKLIE